MKVFDIPRLIHSVSLRLPQRIALRSGLRLYTFDKASNAHFWHTFTSSEYLQFLPELNASKREPPSILIDCGAAVGYFSLLIEHSIRCGLLHWPPISYVAIEASPRNYHRLTKNYTTNLNKKQVLAIQHGLIGAQSGQRDFFVNNNAPWSSSILQRDANHSTKINLDFFNLEPFLNKGNAFIKMDIEGGEFLFLESYKGLLTKLWGIIIEWHGELGDVNYARTLLESSGLKSVKVVDESEQRQVELFLRSA